VPTGHHFLTELPDQHHLSYQRSVRRLAIASDCLQPQRLRCWRTCRVRMRVMIARALPNSTSKQITCPDGISTCEQDSFLPSLSPFEDNDQFIVEPLYMRVCAMQEWLLARRVLEFGARQTQFVCKKKWTVHCNGWTLCREGGSARHYKLVSEIDTPELNNQHLLKSTKHSDSRLLHQLLEDWKSLVIS
jgi:hypothetical protein